MRPERAIEEIRVVFSVNGIASEAEVRNRTIGEVLSELDERAESSGLIIVEIRLDGEALDPDELPGLSTRLATEDGAIELYAEPAAALKARALATLLELVSASTSALGADGAAIAMAKEAWSSFRRSFGGLFSAEEASFLDAFEARLEPDGSRDEAAKLAESLSSFFGERLLELKDPAESMLAAAKVFDSIKEDLSEVPVRLQTGKDAEAMKTMVLAIELIHKTVRIMPEFSRRIDGQAIAVDGTPLPEFYGAFNGVLRELAGAFENKDGILIGDLAEYELKPRLESFFASVKRALEAPR